MTELKDKEGTMTNPVTYYNIQDLITNVRKTIFIRNQR